MKKIKIRKLSKLEATHPITPITRWAWFGWSPGAGLLPPGC